MPFSECIRSTRRKLHTVAINFTEFISYYFREKYFWRKDHSHWSFLYFAKCGCIEQLDVVSGEISQLRRRYAFTVIDNFEWLS